MTVVEKLRPRARAASTAWFVSPFAVLLAVWLIAIPAFDVSARTFPSAPAVWSAFVDLATDGDLTSHVLTSLGRVFAGAGIAVVVGVPFGLLMGMSAGLSAFFAPLLRFSVALAGIAWIPLATLWLGYGNNAVVFVVFNAVFFAIVYNSMLGVRQTSTSLLRAARSLGASRWRMFWEIYLPGALPNIVTGARVGLGFAWRGLIAAEIIATSTGLGYTLFLARQYYETDVIILMMILIGILWLIMDRLILAPLERRTVQRWSAERRERA
ncbi:ABC transporter permease [Jiangella asiatica]|uniref:ABC transporter permease n=1 Tax=Jiangella asiatica TaxID=2530372 RepID=A0A4R5CFU5_9ACTN|nr:ABC transporter permease [Jiangella asiatica]TDD96114.1 ABC transporter permease [Jiangella asiatica]